MRWSPNYHTACRIQDRILNTIGVKPQLEEHYDPKLQAKDLKPSELASLAKAWDTLEDRKRVIRMKPAPRAADVPIKPEKGKADRRSSFQE